MIALIQVSYIWTSVATIWYTGFLARDIPFTIPHHVSIIGFIAAKIAKGCVEATANGCVFLQKMAQVPFSKHMTDVPSTLQQSWKEDVICINCTLSSRHDAKIYGIQPSV